ncbi:MAG: DUF4317 domain-containing protein [Clostridiales bacterium]|nr:DUF4317 domain-containing protein [Roseburia sp.]MDD7636902.1 DUF4317 domain-containing protein [Clostridiales bacterium]MDY4113449.1 DUF4317 domain-containing protein [Roseburia sp.]
MNKKDILELKRRFKKDACTFTRLCGCYVDADRNKVTTFGETFLNLEDEEFYKYLEIAKKVMSGTIGNNILELEFPTAEEAPGGRQQFLMGLRESALKSDELMDAFYDLVIDSYDYVGNYLILVFHDAYDVMTKTSDNNKLDESEEVYEYLLCAICPVSLTKPGLGYREDENRIGPRIRDWVVGVPDTGFVFPAFTDRSTDIHSVMFYTRDTKTPHAEFMESGLGCGTKLTATEKKLTFQNIVKEVIGEDEEDSEALFLNIQGNLNDMIPVTEDETVEPEPVVMTSNAIAEVLTESGVTEEQVAVIEKVYEDVFGEELPEAEQLVDPKMVEANGKRKEKLELVQQVESLKQQLEETRALPVAPSDDEDEDAPAVKTYDVILRVKPEKVGQIHSQIIDGQKCLVIPMEEDEHAAVNGVNTTV